jgi:Rps23 Pro-64 3,4-dihydroxylase Tpa1-like proline 4-hydroxylase
VASLTAQVFAAEPDFVPSTVSDGKDSYRRSLVLNPPAQLTQRVVDKIRALMPEVMARLKMAPFHVTQIECQITANNDGSFFRVHTDAGVNNTIKRQFTFVYYFNRQPKGFSGGELRVYDDVIRNGKLARTDSFQVVEPRHNSIVFFQAAIMHEVMPVAVPSREFRDSRFTVNGWVHRA